MIIKKMRTVICFLLVIIFFMGTMLTLSRKASAISINDLNDLITTKVSALKKDYKNKFKTAYNKQMINIVKYENNLKASGKIPFFKNKPDTSKLVVKHGDPVKVANMINSLSSKRVLVDKNGYIKWDQNKSVNLNKSGEYSMILDGVMNGNATTRIYAMNKPMGAFAFRLPIMGNYIFIGNSPFVSGNNIFMPKTGLAHELIHHFRLDKGIFSSNIRQEEAFTIKLENIIRFKNGLKIRNDGSTLDDVNNDGKPDGDGRYGEYLNKSEQKWPGDLAATL